MLPQAKQALEAQFEYSGQAGTHVFLNPNTKKRWANESKIRGRFKKALVRVDVRYHRPYHCRNTYASTLLSAGEANINWAACSALTPAKYGNVYFPDGCLSYISTS